MEGFLYKKLSEKEKEEIKSEARDIINSFSKKLEKVKDLPNESFIERGSGYREEGKGKSGNGMLKERILKNAPNKNKDFIIAEKKRW